MVNKIIAHGSFSKLVSLKLPTVDLMEELKENETYNNVLFRALSCLKEKEEDGNTDRHKKDIQIKD